MEFHLKTFNFFEVFMSVYACGNGKSYGELGSHEISFLPVQIEGFDGKQVIKIFSNEHSAAAITENGDVYTWGRNREGYNLNLILI